MVGDHQSSPPSSSASSIMLSGSPNSTVRIQLNNNGRPATNFDHPTNGGGPHKSSKNPPHQQPQKATLQQPRGSLACTLLPALDKLSRTRHGR